MKSWSSEGLSEDCKDTGWSSAAPNTGHMVTWLFTTEAGTGCWWGKVVLAASCGISVQISPQENEV